MRVEFQYDLKRREVRIVSDYFSNIREAFSASNPAARFAKNPHVPSRFYAITQSGYCGPGLVPEIYRFLKKQNIPFEIVLDAELQKLLAGLSYTDKETPLIELDCEMKIRPYQKEAIIQALKYGFGVVVVGTGGGKTFIMASLLRNLDTKFGKVLIIVPDIGLVEQTYSDFLSYGIPEHLVTKWSGTNEIDLSKNVIIANLGILQSRMSEIKWFKQISAVFIDECHKLRRGNEVNKLVDKIPTFNRFGFTGTLPEGKIDQWNIMSQIGPVIYEKDTSALRDEGQGQYIANAHCLAVHIEYSVRPDYTAISPSARYITELDFIYNNSFRNDVIKRIIEKVNNNCLILVDHIDHGNRIYDTLSQLTDRQVYFIQGSMEVEDRRKIQAIMEKDNNVICVAISKVFSTGISIKNIHYIMFASGGKSKIKILQSIGRGLRIHENKDRLTIIDIVDELIYGGKHHAKRKEFYALEKIQVQDKTITQS